MKKILFSAALAFALISAANATQPGNNGGGNGGCGVGQQTNGCGGSTGGTGGAGGQGGAGGTGVGLGVGVGIGVANAAANAAAAANATGGNAAVVGSGNSTNSIRNNNTNAQGQQQGQHQGQSQSSRNDNRSNATGGAGGSASATGGASGGNSLTGGAVSVAVEGAKGDVVYAPAQERAPVATAYAAPLTSSNGTCMGSSSAGGQGAAIGLSFGTTWTDNNCDIRYDAEALRAAGLVDAARARLCQKAEIKAAMDAAGTPCQDRGQAKRAEAILNGEQVASATAPTGGANLNDPFIRKLHGLPPLK